ncbi:MAG: PrsW family intramembrane metalloprotease [Bacteroidales bacterium]
MVFSFDTGILQYVLSFLPVTGFLVVLFWFDSFKLVSKSILLLCLLWGIVSAVVSFYVNTAAFESLALTFNNYTRYFSPLVEEVMKSLVLVFLVSRKRIGFTVDAAIYGFAAGTGFALAENMTYLMSHGNGHDQVVWLLRGFGTAIMHGGNTAVVAMLLMNGIQRNKPVYVAVWAGLLTAIMLHSAYNHFFLNPFLQTVFLLIVWPLVFILVFQKSHFMLQNWLEIEFSNEVQMLRMIRQGRMMQTRAGEYLASLRKYFGPEVIVDLYCYISLYLELSIKAKRNLMLRENGFPVMEEPGTGEKLLELQHLRRQIGKAGELALRPLVRMNYRELWKLNLLKK